MTEAIREASIKQAEAVIKGQIARIDSINTTFRSSYSGYTKNTSGQKWAVFFLIVFAASLVCSTPWLIRQACWYVDVAFETPQGMLAVIALYLVSLYAFLYTSKILSRLRRISKIDGYTKETTKVRDVLSKMMDNMESSANDILKQIAAENVDIKPEQDLDRQIEKYEKIANSYHDADNTGIDKACKVFYWISSITFCTAFVALTVAASAEWACRLFGINMYEVFLGVSALAALAGFIWINTALHRKHKGEEAGAYVLSLVSAPASMGAVWVACGALALAAIVLAVAVGIGICAGIIGILIDS